MISVESQGSGSGVPVVLSGSVEDRFEDSAQPVVEPQEPMLEKHRPDYRLEQVREDLRGSYSRFQVVPPLHFFSILGQKGSTPVEFEVVGNPTKRVIITNNGANCLRCEPHSVSIHAQKITLADALCGGICQL